MTTVVFRDGVLASDSAAEIAGWVLPQPHRKVHRLPDGRLAAITGGAASAGLAIEAMKAGNDPDWSALSDDSRVVIVSADGKSVRVHEGKAHYDDVTTPYFAYGSGMPVALGALFAGADAVTAVRAAIAVDTNSGGDVQSERIG
jgi:hypothetical protein